jgi:hypothetical protein
MKCSECSKEAVSLVTVNDKTDPVCQDHKVAIVKRMEQVVQRFSQGGPNLQKITLMAIGEIKFEDLPGARAMDQMDRVAKALGDDEN